MKKPYQARRRCLIEALGRAFDDRARVAGEDAGLHLLVELAGRLGHGDRTCLRERGAGVVLGGARRDRMTGRCELTPQGGYSKTCAAVTTCVT